jgi:hypothetical protein
MIEKLIALSLIERFLNKVQKTTLTLCSLQQRAHATCCIRQGIII